MPKFILSKSPRRRLTMADLMILIAAIGLGLAGSRWSPAGRAFLYGSAYYPSFPYQAITMSAPVAATLTLALIAIPVRSFRSRLRRFALFPGAMACGVAAMALVLIALHWVIRIQMFPITGANSAGYFGRFTFDALRYCGIGVMVSLLVPVLAGWTRLRPDAIDVLRLLIGVYWVAMSLMVGAMR